LILIGQYDSPFVRRVGIALRLYGMPFEHLPYSTFGDWEKFAKYNPLTRVPTLVLDDGEALIESHMIIDYLDHKAGPERALFPTEEPFRHQALKVAALAMGMCDKVVSLFYEKRLHTEISPAWTERCERQIKATMAMLETNRQDRKSAHWFGGRMGHADIAAACAVKFLGEAHPDLLDMSAYPALQAHSERAERMPVFKEISQPFIPPA
jgi:glutathione S-transferase